MSPSRVPILKSAFLARWHACAQLTLRAHRGDLQVALELYRKAETYVPDNIKLRERWILFVVHVFLCKLSRGT